VAVGGEVSEVAVGDRVAYGISNGQGAYAEFAVVPAWPLVKLPGAIDCDTAAAVMQQGMTAHYLAESTFPLAPGHTALIHAAAGGTGLLLVQIAKLRGARVIATVSTAEKSAHAKAAGADEVILYLDQDFAAEARRLTGGRGVDVVYDSVGKATYEKSLDSLAPRGMLVIFGQSSGPVPPFDTAVLNAKGSLLLARPSLTHHTTNRSEVLGRAGDLFNWIASKRLKVHIGATFPLERAADAHRLLAARGTMGKMLLIP
jgi:NADPH2:quinone reductase